MSEDAKRLGLLLASPGSPQASVLDRADRLLACQRDLRDWLATQGDDAAPHLLTMRDHTATLYVDNAAAATALRYRRNELIAFLRSRLGEIERLDIKIRPPPHPTLSGV